MKKIFALLVAFLSLTSCIQPKLTLTDQEISLVGQKYEIQQDAVLVIAHIRKRKDRLTLVDNEYMKSRYALPYFVPLSDVPRGTI